MRLFRVLELRGPALQLDEALNRRGQFQLEPLCALFRALELLDSASGRVCKGFSPVHSLPQAPAQLDRNIAELAVGRGCRVGRWLSGNAPLAVRLSPRRAC